MLTAPTSEGRAIVVSSIIGGHRRSDAGEDEHWKKHPQGHMASYMSVISAISLTSLCSPQMRLALVQCRTEPEAYTMQRVYIAHTV